MAKEKKPKYGLNVHTDMFNLNNMKIYVQLHLARKLEDEKVVGMINKYVTAVQNYPDKVFKYINGEPAYEFYSIGTALDFCVAVGINGYCASVVLASTWNDKAIYTNYAEEKKDAELDNK